MSGLEKQFWDIIEDLSTIIDNPYKPEDSNKNHQTFARALRYIMLHMTTERT